MGEQVEGLIHPLRTIAPEEPPPQGSPASSPSALLYMNADFEGGEFIFTEMDAKTVTVSWFVFLAELLLTEGGR